MARLTLTVDLPTPPLPLPTAITDLTPSIPVGWGASWNGASSLISTVLAPVKSSTAFFTSAWIRFETSGSFEVIMRETATFSSPKTSISLTTLRETMSRDSPGYLTCLRCSKISWGECTSTSSIKTGPEAH
ncbi:MAG: hypothetical protein JW395_0662 [Nitrospira sp.]|nr:hypothetical protein [Nitrospira sp.]